MVCSVPSAVLHTAMCRTSPGELVPGNYTLSPPDVVLGTRVHVVEVVRRDDLRRVRGRIDRPVAGWISLENMDTGFRWARRVRTGLV